MNVRAPRVSVILPVFNGEPFIEEAVRSILTQTFADFELLLVDDGSTDGTGAIVRRLAGEDSRIRLVQRENRGLVASLNEGLALARGEYIARMDADDISDRRRFALQVAYLDANPDVVLLGVRTWQQASHRWRHRIMTGKRRWTWSLLFANHIGHPGVMFRRDTVQRDALRYDPAFLYVEDYRLWCELARRGRVDVLPQALLFYRRHPGAVSVVHAARQRERNRRVIADQFRATFDIALDDVLDADDVAWAEAICTRLFSAPAFAALPAADRRAIHVAYQSWSAIYGFPLFRRYTRLVGFGPVVSGDAGGLAYLYRVLKHELSARRTGLRGVAPP